jgi:hypothetical protein
MIVRRALAIPVMLLTLSSFSALADGTITGVAPDPSPGLACNLNTIRVTGTGACGTFLFKLGDSTPIVHLPGNFPILVYHAYSQAGTYSLTAQGQGNCKGVVDVSLQVLGPTITSMFPFSVIKPGGTVIIQGQNFGNLPGQILINIPSLHQFGGTPLENIQWGNTFASGTIPAGISGVPDQQVTFTVLAQCGAVSNAWTARFTAARDIARLPFDRINCFTFSYGNSDRCQNLGQSNFPMECGSLPPVEVAPGPTGFYGFHASGWGFSGESGNDGFWLSPSQTLNNDWVVDSVTSLSGWKIGNGSSATEAWASQPGATNPGVNVNWYSDNCGAILYTGDIMVTGPVGMPY